MAGKKAGTKRQRDKQREMALELAGRQVIEHTPEAAVDEAEKRALDYLFPTDESHEVPPEVGRAKFRLVLDIETMWDQPPYQSHEQVMETVRSYVIKSLAAHKYLQLGGIVTRMEPIE